MVIKTCAGRSILAYYIDWTRPSRAAISVTTDLITGLTPAIRAVTLEGVGSLSYTHPSPTASLVRENLALFPSQSEFLRHPNMRFFSVGGLLVILCSVLPVSAIHAADGDSDQAASPSTKRIVLIAGPRSHGYGAHEHYAGCRLLAETLRESKPDYEITVFKNGWPEDNVDQIADADTVVVYCDGGRRHLLNRHIEEFGEVMKSGVGLICLHYGVETTKGETGDAFLDWIGGYFEAGWSVNPTWEADFTALPDHPISSGVKPFKINDEWYFHMRFREGMEGVTPILSAHPPEDTMRRPDGPHHGNPFVRKAVAAGEIQHVAWAAEREGGGRGFGFTGGHFHWNWADENFRKVVLNAIVWTAHGEIPEDGVSSDNPSQEKLEENQDEPKPSAQSKKNSAQSKKPSAKNKKKDAKSKKKSPRKDAAEVSP